MKLTDETKDECIEALAKAGWERMTSGTQLPTWERASNAFTAQQRLFAKHTLRPIFEIIERQEP